MSGYSYKVIYDLEKDAKNWLTASRERSFGGKNWREGLYGYYLEEYDKISSLSDNEAKTEIENFIASHLMPEVSDEEKAITDKLQKKYRDACSWIIELTGKDIPFSELLIYITTFPRAPYSVEEGIIYYCFLWKDIIGKLLHELLHIQLHTYWRHNDKSLVSRLNDGQYEALTESLTFLINETLGVLAEQPDNGYPQYSNLREKLQSQWENNKNFDRLIEYGAKELLK